MTPAGSGKQRRRGRTFGTVERIASGRWRARFRPHAGALRVTAPETFKTKADASAWLATQQADLGRGVWTDARAGASVTVKAWGEEWLAAPRKRRTTLARDTSVLRTWLYPTLGTWPVNRVTPLDVRRVVAAMAEDLAPATVRTDYGVIRALFAAAVDADLIGRSPCRGIELPVPSQGPGWC